MPAAWRLAINSLFGRPSRSLLLGAAVALSASLIAAVACAMASLDKALLERAKITLGGADLRVKHVGGGVFDRRVADVVRSWPEVALVVPHFRDSLALRNPRAAPGSQGAAESGAPTSLAGGGSPSELVALAYGIDIDNEAKVRAFQFTEGRAVERRGEIVIDLRAQRELSARLGDELEVIRFGEPAKLKVVGVVKPPPLGDLVSREEVFLSLDELAELAGKVGRLSELNILVEPGVDAAKVARDRRPPGSGALPRVSDVMRQKFFGQTTAPGPLVKPEPKPDSKPDPKPEPNPAAAEEQDGASAPQVGEPLPGGLLLQATERITSGLQKNMQSNQVALVMASVLSFIGASFIIMTGLTTAVTERTRELAVLRCIGAFRGQLATSQLLVGAMVGALGAVVGGPMGVFAAWVLVQVFPEQLPGGFGMSWLGVGLSALASLGAGVVGAAWPAIIAARTSPLEGLALRSKPPALGWVWVCMIAAPILIAIHPVTLLVPKGIDQVFWVYITLGLPGAVTGYFLLSVPVTAAITRLAAGPLSFGLGLPPRLLRRTVSATPFRHGFTAGAMMLGLSIMVAIWTNGQAIMRDWLDALALPDAFIYGTSLKSDVDKRIAELPEVALTCAITRQTVQLDEDKRAGIKGLAKFNTYFFGFEPEPFFKMTKVVWEQGEPRAAIERLKKGDAVLVERAFRVARGVNLGDKINVHHQGQTFTFEVVGVISSPGLDVASKFLEVGEQFVDNAVNSVFGSRDDMIAKFGNDAVNFVQIAFKEGADGREGLRKARLATGGGVLISVLATEMKDRIREAVGGSLVVFSLVAVGAMLVACFGVANVIIAGIQTRQFEFGVLRAVGAQRELLGRLVIGEAIIIALGACVLGTAMGLQAAWGGMQISRMLLGIELHVSIYPLALFIGWTTVFAITLGAAWPSVHRLVRRQPRELLGAMKG